MLVEIMMAIKAIQSSVQLLEKLIGAVEKLSLTIEEKQISKFKEETREELQKIQVAQNDNDRKRLIVELSRKLSQ